MQATTLRDDRSQGDMTHHRSLAIALGVSTWAIAAPARADGTFTLGAGFRPDDGFLAAARVAQDDLFGTGHGLALSAELSERYQQFVVAYDAPLGDGVDLHAELYDVRRRLTGFTREGAGGSLELGKRIARNTRVYVRYRAEYVSTELLAQPLALMTNPPLDRGDGLLATLRAGVVHDTRDAPMLARSGTRLELYGETADARLGSAHELARIGASFEHARPLGGLTLRVSGRATYVHSNEPGGVPLSERLFHDGHADVRGYGLGDVGTFGPMFGGDAGANLEAIGRAELELPLFAGLSIAGFFDAGLRYNRDAAWGPVSGDTYRSVGASLIWRSPIGPLRFDLAFPLDGDDRDRQFLFGIGY